MGSKETDILKKYESHRRSKLIGDPDRLDRMYKNLPEEETYAAPADLRRWEDMYFGTVIQYINQYLYSIVDAIPKDDEEIWKCPRNTRMDTLQQ